jgi:hypothetical protein
LFLHGLGFAANQVQLGPEVLRALAV